jgi:hypothetical protein
LRTISAQARSVPADLVLLVTSQAERQHCGDQDFIVRDIVFRLRGKDQAVNPQRQLANSRSFSRERRDPWRCRGLTGEEKAK